MISFNVVPWYFTSVVTLANATMGRPVRIKMEDTHKRLPSGMAYRTDTIQEAMESTFFCFNWVDAHKSPSLLYSAISDFVKANFKTPHMSASVGDIFEVTYNGMTEFYMIENTGFKKLDEKEIF